MVIIVQEPEILVYHRVGQNIVDPIAIAVYNGTTIWPASGLAELFTRQDPIFKRSHALRYLVYFKSKMNLQ